MGKSGKARSTGKGTIKRAWLLKDETEGNEGENMGSVNAASVQKTEEYALNLEKRLIEQEEQINQLRFRESELKLKNEQLLSAISERDKFFTIIAHDLRNPLQALKGFIQIMTEDIDNLTPDDIKDITFHIQNSTTHLSELLENLMLWARLQRGLTLFSREVVQLSQVGSDSVLLMSGTAAGKGIEISVDIPDNLRVFADANILQTVIRNLISNAVKFTHEGGKITLSARAYNDVYVEISVSDTGIGISREMIGDLFKLDSGTTRTGSAGESGTGLGLIICKDFVENQGGSLWVESEENKGSTFYFTLPVNNLQ
jgi:signal transduction histidine kinase